MSKFKKIIKVSGNIAHALWENRYQNTNLALRSNEEECTQISGNGITSQQLELAMNKIKELKKKIPEKVEFERFKTSGGFFGLGNHRITGDEGNVFGLSVQSQFVSVNDRVIELANLMQTLFSIINVLDEDLLNGLFVSTEMAKKAGMDALKAQEEITETINWLISAYEKIKSTMEALENTQTELSFLQTRMDSIGHLDDIDDMWIDFEKIKSKLSRVVSITDSCVKDVEKLNKFKENLSRIKHIYDVDKLWDDIQDVKTDISDIRNDVSELVRKTEDGSRHIIRIEDELNSHRQSIQKTAEFADELRQQSHLKDIDTTWDKCLSNEENIQNVKEGICHQDEEIDGLKSELAKLKSSINENNKLFSKKLTLAYVFTGASVVMSAIEMILLMLR